jgi:hypothetical protein
MLPEFEIDSNTKVKTQGITCICYHGNSNSVSSYVVWLLHTDRYYSGTALNLFLKYPLVYLADSKMEKSKLWLSFMCIGTIYSITWN